jgi:hypothetical protein
MFIVLHTVKIVYICLFMTIPTSIFFVTDTHTRAHTYIRTCICMYVYTCMYVCMYVFLVSNYHFHTEIQYLFFRITLELKFANKTSVVFFM